MSRLALVLLVGFTLAFSPLGLSAADPPAKKKLLLVAQGPDSHPPKTHEYAAGLKVLQKLLAPVKDQVEITLVRADGEWLEGPDLLRDTDGVVLFLSEGAKWIHGDPRRLEALAQLSARGGGLVALHWALGAKEARYIDGYQKLFGGVHGGPDRKFKFLETSLTVIDAEHPITRGVEKLTINDEFYYQIKFVADERGLKPLVQAKIDDEAHVVVWAWERPDGGRSFAFTGLHFHENWQRAEYQRLIAQGVLWSIKTEVPQKDFPGQLVAEDFELPAASEIAKP
jgi:type 1 glutamine amidotransferase